MTHPPSPPARASEAPANPPGEQRAEHARARLRLGLWIALVIALAVGLPAWFYLLRDGLMLERLPLLHRGWLGFSAACVGAWALLATTPQEAIRISPRAGKRILLLLSALLAAGALLWLKPVLSAEVLRYRFDGRIWLLGMNPYQVSPAQAAALAADAQDPELRPDPLDLAARNPRRTTLNLPVSQAGFVASRALEYVSPPSPAVEEPADLRDWRGQMLDLPWWRQLFFWRCVLAGAFLLAVGEIITWLRQRNVSPWWVVTFAWQPLVLVESIGAGHQDLVGALFLIAGLRRAEKNNFRRTALCLAASVAVKPWALVVLPFIVRRAWKGEPGDVVAEPASAGGAAAARRLVVWFTAALVVLTSPIWVGGGLFDLWTATWDFLATSPRDGGVYRLLEAMFVGPEASQERISRVRMAAWILCGSATVAAGLVAWRRQVRPAAAFYAISVAALLTSPAISPWVLVWPLAVVPALAGRAGPVALIWAGTAVLHYGSGTLAGIRLPAQTLMFVLAPVYVAALLEGLAVNRHAARIRRRRVAQAQAAPAV